jgi:hypothetical protein
MMTTTAAKIPAALNQKSHIRDIYWDTFVADTNAFIIARRKEGWRVISCTQITEERINKKTGKKYSQFLFIIEEESCAHEALQMIQDVVASSTDPFRTDAEKYAKIVEIVNASKP